MICPACEHNNLPGSESCVHCSSDLTQLEQPVPYDRVERSLLSDTVHVLQPRPAVTLCPEATAASAVRLLLDCNIGALPIVDAAGNLVGIFSERDVLMKMTDSGPDQSSRPVSDYMTRNPETVRESDPLVLVLHKMHLGGYRHLPVLREGRVLGMISVRDVVRHVTDMSRSSHPG
jgi:CBS domain-containing protein